MAQSGRVLAPLLTRHRLERGLFTSVQTLEEAIQRYIKNVNQHPRPFVWTKSADAILASIARFCQRISNSQQ
jgi:hypothetical protein